MNISPCWGQVGGDRVILMVGRISICPCSDNIRVIVPVMCSPPPRISMGDIRTVVRFVCLLSVPTALRPQSFQANKILRSFTSSSSSRSSSSSSPLFQFCATNSSYILYNYSCSSQHTILLVLSCLPGAQSSSLYYLLCDNKS